MEVKFLTVQGTEYSINIEPGTTLGVAKEVLSKQYNLPVKQYKFCRKQSVLNDNSVVGDEKDGKIIIYDTSIFPQRTFPASHAPFNLSEIPFIQYSNELRINNRNNESARRSVLGQFGTIAIMERGMIPHIIDPVDFNEYPVQEPSNAPSIIDNSFLYSGVDDFQTPEERQNRQSNQNHRNLDREYPYFEMDELPMMMDERMQYEFIGGRPFLDDQIFDDFAPARPNETDDPEQEREIIEAAGDLPREEEQTIRRLMIQYHQPRAVVLQVYDACERNEAMAANLLSTF